jgi:hypothetical protein
MAAGIVLAAAFTECVAPFTVRLRPVEVHADDRIEFSRFARRVLNVINAKRYPRYTPRPKMEPWDAKYFTFLRY